MPERGIAFHPSLFEKLEQLAKENNTSYNRFAVSMIEIGIPVFAKIRRSAPTIAKELTRKRYSFNLRPQAQNCIDRIADKEATKVKLTKRVCISMSQRGYWAIKTQAKRQHRAMTEIGREKLGVT